MTIEGGLTTHSDTISEVFLKMPDEWTPADEVRMVEELRKRRKEFDAAPEKKPKAEKKPAVPKVELKGLSGRELLAKLSLAPKS